MPRVGDIPGVADVGIDAFLAQVRRETTPLVWLGLVIAAVLFALSPILTVSVPLPSMLLPAGLRDRHADRVCSSRFYLLRQSIVLLKMYACLCWGQAPAVRARLSVAPYPADPGTFRIA